MKSKYDPRALKKAAEAHLQGMGRKMGQTVRGAYRSRMQAQKNFQNRTNNSNYAGTWGDWQ